MSRKSRERMNAGIYKPKRGQEPAGASGRVTKLPRERAAVMVAKLTACQPWEREGVREYLRRDGSARALALLGELEEKWAASPPGQQPGTEED